MGFWQEVSGNQVLISACLGWVTAQVLKTTINVALDRSFTLERLVRLDGMPSSHSSTVCALMVNSGVYCRIGSFKFATSFVLVAMVIYDAIDVCQRTGKQTRLLNVTMEQNILKMDDKHSQQKLKEFVGHTPLQMFAGAALGIGIALLINLSHV